MSKPQGKRRRTVRAELKRRQVESSKTGGMICARCGQVVAFDAATFYRSNGEEAVFCIDCAFFSDDSGYVALLWSQAPPSPASTDTGAREEGRSSPPS